MSKNYDNLQLISQKKVCELLTITSTTLWRWEQKGNFPKKVVLGHTRVAYRLTDIEKWIDHHQT